MSILNTKIEDIAPPLRGEVVCADKNDSIPTILSTMSQHNILALPVIDKKNRNQLVGYVDMLDIITFVVRFIEESHALTDRKNFDQYMQQCQASFDSVSQIAGISNKNKLLLVKLGTSVLEVMRMMISEDAERVVLLNPQNEIVNVVTQSTVVHFLSKHNDYFGFSNETLIDMGIKNTEIVAVKENAMTLDAFKAISENKITGIPILDSDGHILTNISCRDLRDVVSDPFFFEMARSSVEKFVTELKSRTFMPNADTMYPKICCKLNSRWVDVVHKLAATKIHRIYVVDTYDHPVSVVSLQDVIVKYLSSIPPSSTSPSSASASSSFVGVKPSRVSSAPSAPAVAAK